VRQFTLPDPDNFFEYCRATFVENWTPVLRAMTIPYSVKQMTRHQMIALGSIIVEMDDLFTGYYGELPDHLSEYSDRVLCISNMIEEQWNAYEVSGAEARFVRLGSRSPKDSYDGFKKRYRCECPGDAMTLLKNSERIGEDLASALMHDYLSSFVIRPWVKIVDGSEARCFVRDGVCCGVSEYNYRAVKQGFSTARQAIQRDPSIGTMYEESYHIIAEAASRAAGIADLVIDIGCVEQGDGSYYTPLVIEINPLSFTTDPCLFSWDNPSEFKPKTFKLL
jgi:hypothetical protein